MWPDEQTLDGSTLVWQSASSYPIDPENTPFYSFEEVEQLYPDSIVEQASFFGSTIMVANGFVTHVTTTTSTDEMEKFMKVISTLTKTLEMSDVYGYGINADVSMGRFNYVYFR